MAFNPFKLVGLGKSLKTLVAILAVSFPLALIAGFCLLSRQQSATIAGEYCSYQLQMEHGLSLGSPYKGKAALIEQLGKRGFSLLRRLKDDNFEFESPGLVYLLRIKTHRGVVSSIYHYLRANAKRPESRPCFLGCDLEELKQRLGAPSAIEDSPVPSCRYDLADAVLTIVFGNDGWAVETDLQRPIVRERSAASS